MKNTCNEKKLKVAIIGCGGIANGKHLPAIKKNNNIEIEAFCDLIEKKAIEAKAKYGKEESRIYTDYKLLLAKEKILRPFTS